jgi:uncharacterized protein
MQRYKWYDTWLKGQNTGLDKARSPMHLYEVNTDRWVNADSYPITHRYTPYYLEAKGELSTQRPAASDGDALAWGDPAMSGTTLTYTTKPFNDGATLAGAMAATIYASSSNTNMELIATLNDLAPDGTVSQITTGALLGSMHALAESKFERRNDQQRPMEQLFDANESWFDDDGHVILPRHPFDADSYLMPGKLEQMDLELFSLLWSVLPGHSLQLVLSTQGPSDLCASLLSALAKPSPCVLTAPQQKTLPGGSYQISRTRLHASAVNLPLLPFEKLHEVASATTPTSPSQTQPLDWGTPQNCSSN